MGPVVVSGDGRGDEVGVIEPAECAAEDVHGHGCDGAGMQALGQGGGEAFAKAVGPGVTVVVLEAFDPCGEGRLVAAEACDRSPGELEGVAPRASAGDDFSGADAEPAARAIGVGRVGCPALEVGFAWGEGVEQTRDTR